MVGAGLATLALFASSSFDDIAPWAVLLGLRLMILGVGLFFAARSLPPGELDHLGRMLRPLALPTIVTIAWALIQCLPLSAWANPVWSSAAAALPGGVAGHITVDLQATVFSIFQVAAAALVVLLVGVQTADRTRAEDALVVLGAAALVLPALGQALQRFGSAFDAVNQAAALDCLIIVPTMACAWGDLALERYETRRAGQARARQNVLAIVSACGVVALCCLVAVGLIGGTGAVLAAATGILVFFSIVLSRRFGWGIWLIAAMLVLLLFAFIAVETNAFGTAQTVIAGSWAPNGIERQMLRDAPLVGTGLGTSTILSNLYRTLEDADVFASTSAAARGMVELGAPVFWGVVASFAVIEGLLIRDAMRRGRDSVYAVLGASILPCLLVVVFINPGVVDWDVIVVAGGILGLALSQRQGRTIVR